MLDDKVHCMQVARKYGEDFWDGARRYGYGGYRYDGRWEGFARKLVEIYSLTPESSILDVGCGKGFLLYELTRLLPGCRVSGFDISRYAVENSKEEVRPFLFYHPAEDSFPFNDGEFDLVISLMTLHNLKLFDLQSALQEMERVGKNRYLSVESFRNEAELFNLQCWALTCQTFMSPEEWEWFFQQSSYTGDYEFVYFE